MWKHYYYTKHNADNVLNYTNNCNTEINLDSPYSKIVHTTFETAT